MTAINQPPGREPRKPHPMGIVLAAGSLMAAGGVIYFSVFRHAPEPPPGSPYARILCRKCTDPGCGHVVEDRALDLVENRYIHFEAAVAAPNGPFTHSSSELIGEGRRCPRCDKLTLRLAERDAAGVLVFRRLPQEEGADTEIRATRPESRPTTTSSMPAE